MEAGQENPVDSAEVKVIRDITRAARIMDEQRRSSPTEFLEKHEKETNWCNSCYDMCKK
jgi:hypothetical protein